MANHSRWWSEDIQYNDPIIEDVSPTDKFSPEIAPTGPDSGESRDFSQGQ